MEASSSSSTITRLRRVADLISAPTGRYYIQLLEANCHGMTTVMIEWAGKLVLAVFARSVSKSGSSSAVSFITITDLPPGIEPVSKLGLVLPTDQPCLFAEA